MKNKKKYHIIGNLITNFENSQEEKIKKDGWKPIYKNNKIVEWK